MLWLLGQRKWSNGSFMAHDLFVGFWYAHEPGPDIKLPCDWHPSLLAT